jgi:hypothetical protein
MGVRWWAKAVQMGEPFMGIGFRLRRKAVHSAGWGRTVVGEGWPPAGLGERLGACRGWLWAAAGWPAARGMGGRFAAGCAVNDGWSVVDRWGRWSGSIAMLRARRRAAGSAQVGLRPGRGRRRRATATHSQISGPAPDRPPVEWPRRGLGQARGRLARRRG